MGFPRRRNCPRPRRRHTGARRLEKPKPEIDVAQRIRNGLRSEDDGTGSLEAEVLIEKQDGRGFVVDQQDEKKSGEGRASRRPGALLLYFNL